MCSTPSADGSCTAQTRGQTTAVALFLVRTEGWMGPSGRDPHPAVYTKCSHRMLSRHPLYSTKSTILSAIMLFNHFALRKGLITFKIFIKCHFILQSILSFESILFNIFSWLSSCHYCSPVDLNSMEECGKFHHLQSAVGIPWNVFSLILCLCGPVTQFSRVHSVTVVKC